MFFFKKKIVCEIPSNAVWGHLINEYHVDSDTLTKAMRCVIKKGEINGNKASLIRIFDMREITKRNVTITGWETFDLYPDLIAYEGYCLEGVNQAFLKKKPE